MLTRIVVAIGAGLLAGQRPVATTDDLGVYQAVLAHTIQSEVDRFSAAAGFKTPAPVLVLDTTMAICRGEGDPRPVGCVRAEHVQSFQKKTPRMQTEMFEGRLTVKQRQQLATTFQERNRENYQFPGNELAGLIPVRPAELADVQKRESNRTRGISRFSVPGYSSDGRALVYATYVCGGLCGEGWFFLLERHQQSWRVVDRVGLWIS